MASFAPVSQHGQGNREHGGRRFTDSDEMGLAALLQAAPCFAVLETWMTRDQRPERADDCWFNTLLMQRGEFSPK